MADDERENPIGSELQANENGAANVGASSPPAPSPPPSSGEKPLNDVVAGAMARAASQGTIHPLDTLKVQMQVGKRMQQQASKFTCDGHARAVLQQRLAPGMPKRAQSHMTMTSPVFPFLPLGQQCSWTPRA